MKTPLYALSRCCSECLGSGLITISRNQAIICPSCSGHQEEEYLPYVYDRKTRNQKQLQTQSNQRKIRTP